MSLATQEHQGLATGVSAPSAARGAARRQLRRRARSLGWLGPSLLLIGGVVIYPVIAMGIASLHRYDNFGIDHGYAGLSNYRTLFAEPDLGHVLTNTILWVGVVVGLTMVISLGLAQFLSKRFVGRRIVRLALIVPWASSLVITSIVWRFMYDYYYGYLNRVLLDLGIIHKAVAWYENPHTAMWSLIALGVILSVPFTTYVILAGLQAIPEEMYEAARVDGARRLGIYHQVTLPLLRPALIVAGVLNTIYVFNSFPVIWTITGDVPGYQTDTTITYMYKLAFKTNLNIGESAALSVLNVLFVCVLVVIYLRLTRANEPGDARPRRQARWRRGLADRLTVVIDRGDRLRVARAPEARRFLTGWAHRRSAPPLRCAQAAWSTARPVALPIIGALIAAFFLAPYLVMFLSSVKSTPDLFASPARYLPTHWHWGNWPKAFTAVPLGTYLKNSLIIAGAGTALVLVVSLPAAYYTARTRFRGRSTFLYLVLATQMFAPVVVVIGIYREFLTFHLSDSLVALVLADGAFNLAFAIWIMNAYFASVPKEIEEAALLDRLTRFQAMRKVILPLALPGVVTAVIFTFISIWNEFVVALTLISSPGKEPLTVGIESFLGAYQPAYQYLFVGSLIAIVPVVILFGAIERYIVRGLTAGSVR